MFAWLIHLKIKLFGDKELETESCKMLPCKKCGKQYMAYMHHNDVYDTYCKDCLEAKAKWDAGY